MSRWMMELFNLSLAASLVVLVVLFVRLLLRKAPKKYSYFLWIAVFFRAICPVSFSSPFSMFRLFPFWKTSGSQLDIAVKDYQAARFSTVIAGTTAVGTNTDTLSASEAAGITFLQVLSWIWLAGFVLLLAYGVISWLKLRQRVALAVKTEEGIYESDRISTAFVLGICRPRIYLPTGLSVQERKLVQEHERVHLCRHDQIFKMAAWLVTVVHWFNPLLWAAFVLMTRDMEMSCDEKVLETLGEKEKKEYSSFLLALAAPEGFPFGSPLAFGESAVKSRIKNILQYRKGSVTMAALAVLLLVLVLVGCMSNPKEQSEAEVTKSTDGENMVIGSADGPTSVFVAGKPGEESSEAELEEALGEQYRILVFLEEWAQAVANRDADAVYEMLSPKLQGKAEKLGIETAENGVRVMGWSSPFVPEGIAPIVMLGTGESIQAEILYPAVTSDPSWWVWKDYLTIEPKGDSFQVTAWEEKTYFEIAALEDFLEAYSAWMPDYLSQDEADKSFADYIQEHYDAGMNPDYYEQYLLPARAAEQTLHLSGGTAKVQNEGQGKASVVYQWADGEVQIDMVQPVKTGSGGIWVPEGWTAQSEE